MRSGAMRPGGPATASFSADPVAITRADHDRDFVMQRRLRAIRAPYRSLRAANALDAEEN